MGIRTVRLSDITITDCDRIAELGRWIPLAELERDALTLAA
jgi:hypothetical protein